METTTGTVNQRSNILLIIWPHIYFYCASKMCNIFYCWLWSPPGCSCVQISRPQQTSNRKRHRPRHLWPLQNEPKGLVWLPECESHISRPVLGERWLSVSGAQENPQVSERRRGMERPLHSYIVVKLLDIGKKNVWMKQQFSWLEVNAGDKRSLNIKWDFCSTLSVQNVADDILFFREALRVASTLLHAAGHLLITSASMIRRIIEGAELWQPQRAEYTASWHWVSHLAVSVVSNCSWVA